MVGLSGLLGFPGSSCTGDRCARRRATCDQRGASAVGLTAGDEEASAMKPSGSSAPALLPRLPSFPGASPSQGPGALRPPSQRTAVNWSEGKSPSRGRRERFLSPPARVMESGLGLRRSRGEPRSPWEEQQPSQRPRGRCRIPARTAGKASRNGASSSCTC
ncbi:unnamed protein product [Lepidochelys olivacea]